MTLIEALRHEHLEVTDAAAAEIERLEAEVRRVTDFYGKTPMDSFRRIEALEAENAALKAELGGLPEAQAEMLADCKKLTAENAALKNDLAQRTGSLMLVTAENAALKADAERTKWCIESMKQEAETAGASGDKQMLQDACEEISRQGLEWHNAAIKGEKL